MSEEIAQTIAQVINGFIEAIKKFVEWLKDSFTSEKSSGDVI